MKCMVKVIVVSKINNIVVMVKNRSKQQKRWPNIVVMYRASGIFCVRWGW